MAKNIETVISGATIPYGDGLAMQCCALMGGSEPRFFNFLDYYDVDTAQRLALELSLDATHRVLALRRASVEGRAGLSLPDEENVYDFVAGKFGMEPIGSLLYVDHDDTEPEGAERHSTNAGVTYLMLRAVFIHKDRIDQDFGPGYEDLAEGINILRTASVAAHELTHLAGSQDKLFFSLDESQRRIAKVHPVGTTLNGWPNIKQGDYFEEGFGTLVQNLYAWEVASLETISSRFNSVERFKSPSGIESYRQKRGGF